MNNIIRFYLTIEHDFVEIDEENITTVEIPEFVPPPVGTSTFKDFKMLCHIHLIEENQEKEDEGQED
jgi:hypothetical protein